MQENLQNNRLRLAEIRKIVQMGDFSSDCFISPPQGLDYFSAAGARLPHLCALGVVGTAVADDEELTVLY